MWLDSTVWRHAAVSPLTSQSRVAFSTKVSSTEGHRTITQALPGSHLEERYLTLEENIFRNTLAIEFYK